MGEIRIKSGNLFDGELEQGSLNSNDGSEVINNIRVRTMENTLLKEGTYTINCTGATGGVVVCAYNTDDLSYDKSASYVGQWRALPFTFIVNDEKLYRFAFKKEDDSAISPSEITNIQIIEGSYTSENIPEYQPYFLNRPAHQITNSQFVDIPTHHYTNGRWQGELTSQSPLKFWADGDMLDWRVEGKTSGNLFDIGKNVNDYERAYQMISVDGSLISMKLEGAGMTFHYRTHNITTTGTVTIYCKGSKAKPQLFVRLRSMDNTKWLTNSDVTISGMAYNSVYNGWFSYARGDTFIKTIIIPECLYWNMGVGFNSEAGTMGEIVTISNPMVISGTYTTSTLPPYEPYGGVGDWDETTQRYKIPINVRGGNLYSSAWEQGFWAYDTGSGWGTDSKYVRTAKIPCEGNTKYEFICSLPDGAKDYGFVFWDANGNYIGNIHSSDVQNTPVKYSATSPANAKMMAINIARYSDGERHPVDILSFDLYELHEVNLYTNHQLLNGNTIDYATDQTSILIATGNNTLTVDTAVQPKNVFVKFEG